MIYVENMFVCFVAPLIIAFFLLRGEARRFIGFYVLGLLVCLLSAYINSYLAAILTGNVGYATMTEGQTVIQLTPIIEEVMKALPVFLFAAIASPKQGSIVSVSLAVGLGFATFENICYITRQGAGDFIFALIRGFSAGVMHAVCAAILGYGLAFVCNCGRMAYPGAFALLCASSTFHGIYNLLVAGDGAMRTAGYVIPLVTAAIILFVIMWRGGGTTPSLPTPTEGN
jgi:RsiW-degrading membrane proteinase PrsW (M82 family)